MAYENTNPFSGFFWGNDPNINQQLRQRIALTMLAQSKNRGYPKNIGEGLTAIGDSLGDIGMMRMLERSGAAENAADKADIERLTGGGGPSTVPSTVPSTGPRTETDVSPQAPDTTVSPATTQTPVQTSDLTPAEQAAGVVGSGANALDAAGAADPWAARRRAIAGIESGGAKDPYSLMGATTRTGDRAYGKYQVMGENIPAWTKAATGTALTPQQYLANKPAQEATFQNQFGQYADKYGDAGAAKAWFAGERGMQNPNATDIHGRLSVAGYGQDYLSRLKAAGGQPADARAAVTDAIMARQPSPAPVPRATDFSSVNRNATIPPDTGIAPAPTPDTGITTAPPPVQVAQTAPVANPFAGAQMPVAPTPTPMSSQEFEMRKAASDPNRSGLAQRLAPYIKQLEDIRTATDARNVEEYKSRMQQYGPTELERRKFEANRPEYEVKAADARSIARSGMPLAANLELFNKEKPAIDQTIQAQGAQQLARNAIRAGVITGFGANGALVGAKFMDWAKGNGMQGNLAANTEIMSAALKFGLQNAIETINGVGGKVSDSDLRIAQGMQATDPALQMKTIKTIMDRAAQVNYDKINSYEKKLEHDLGGDPAELRYTPSLKSLIPLDDVKKLESHNGTPLEGKAKSDFDEKYGPGAADFTLERALRVKRRIGTLR